jgi:hypothetical protein
VHPAKIFEFERLAEEFRAWRAVPAEERSNAAPWWWGSAIALRSETEPMQPHFCAALDLPTGATYADAASELMTSIATQKSLPWPHEFPRKPADSTREATDA